MSAASDKSLTDVVTSADSSCESHDLMVVIGGPDGEMERN